MKDFLLYFLLFFLIARLSLAEHNEKTWHFALNNNIVFDNGEISSGQGNIDTWESATVISDQDGNLVLYSNGINLWNANGDKINDENLSGHWSSGEGCILVKQPGHRSIYYLFTAYGNEDFYFNNKGFVSHKIDMNANDGKGKVVEIKKLLPNVTEKVAACKHAFCGYIWIITYNSVKNEFYSFRLTPEGLDDPIVNKGIEYDAGPFGGYITISPSGRYLTHCAQDRDINTIEIWDFDRSTGIISNPRTIYGINLPYCARFSSDETKLYVSSYEPSKLYQYDVSEIDNIDKIRQSETLIRKTNYVYYYGAIQEGPDGKLYVSQFDQYYLGCIEKPNLTYPDCYINDKAVSLKNKAQFSLPNFGISPELEKALYLKIFTENCTCEVDEHVDIPIYFSLPSNSIKYDELGIRRVELKIEYDVSVVDLKEVTAISDSVYFENTSSGSNISLFFDDYPENDGNWLILKFKGYLAANNSTEMNVNVTSIVSKCELFAESESSTIKIEGVCIDQLRPVKISEILDIDIPQNSIVYSNAEIKATIPNDDKTSMYLLDATGRKLHTFFENRVEKGDYQINWSSINIPPGYYSLIFKNSRDIIAKNLLLIK